MIKNLLTILFALLPSFAWFYFFNKEDVHPEPKKKIFVTFLFGGIFSFLALFLELFFVEFTKNFIYSKILIMFYVALVEEIIKFLPAFFTNNRSKDFDEPVDAMIYMICSALGFAAVENFLIISERIYFGYNVAFEAMILRFLGATLLHVFSSSILGYYWALSHFKNKKQLFPLGIVLAVIVHFVFNILALEIKSLKLFYLLTFLVLVSFFVFADFKKLKKEI